MKKTFERSASVVALNTASSVALVPADPSASNRVAPNNVFAGPQVRLADPNADVATFAARLGGTSITERVHTTLIKSRKELGPRKVKAIIEKMARDHDGALPDELDHFLAYCAPALVAQADAAAHEPDVVVGTLTELVSTSASIPKRCGNHLTTALGIAIDAHPDFVVLSEVRVPLAAQAVEWAAAERKRLQRARGDARKAAVGTGCPPAEIVEEPETRRIAPDHSEGAPFYTADLVLIDRRTRTVWILESKRGGGASDRPALAKVADKLRACRICVPAWLREAGIEDVDRVRVGILDHLGKSGSDPLLAIKGGEFDAAFGIRGIDAVTTRLHGAVADAARPVLARLLCKTARESGMILVDPKATTPPSVAVQRRLRFMLDDWKQSGRRTRAA